MMRKLKTLTLPALAAVAAALALLTAGVVYALWSAQVTLQTFNFSRASATYTVANDLGQAYNSSSPNSTGTVPLNEVTTDEQEVVSTGATSFTLTSSARGTRETGVAYSLKSFSATGIYALPGTTLTLYPLAAGATCSPTYSNGTPLYQGALATASLTQRVLKPVGTSPYYPETTRETLCGVVTVPSDKSTPYSQTATATADSDLGTATATDSWSATVKGYSITTGSLNATATWTLLR